MAKANFSFYVFETDVQFNFSLVLDGARVRHYRIRQGDIGGYFLSATLHFATLIDLVAHYSKNLNHLCARLAVPCPKVRNLQRNKS